MKKYIIIIFFLFIIGAAYFMLNVYKKHNNKQNLIFINDSSFVASLDYLKFYNPDKFQTKYETFVVESYNNPKYLPLVEKLDSLKVRINVAPIRIDWENGKRLKRNTKRLILLLKDYFNNKAKFIPDTIYIAETSLGKKALNLHEKYGWDKKDCMTIAKSKVRIGMTDKMVRKAWGEPGHINRTIHAYGVHEQWDYKSGISCYFDDGTLTRVQK